jgi:hypothetical protein
VTSCEEIGKVSFLPVHDGDGYSYGGGIIVTIGDLSINLGGFEAMRGYDKRRVALAHNLAAAPDLLEALRRLLGTSTTKLDETHEPGCRCVIHEALAAIAKAEGRSDV